MTTSDERLRPHPNTRLSGPAVRLDLAGLAAALRGEPHPPKDGHRQVGLVHRGDLRIVLFTFDAGGHLPEHTAPGHVLVHCLRGRVQIRTGSGNHELEGGHALVLDPGIPHSLEAREESDVLLTISLQR